MKRVIKKARNILIAALCVSMCFGSFTCVYADTNDAEEKTTISSQENSSGEDGNNENKDSNEYIENNEQNEGNINQEQDKDTDNSLSNGQDDGGDDSDEDIAIAEQKLTAAQPSAVSEAPVEENTLPQIDITGIFGCTVEDSKGTVINGWYSDDDKCYYMFLTRACSIPDVVLNISGVIVSGTTKGTIDTKTNSISGAFASSGDSISVTDNDGKQYNVVVMQSDIPSISINLNGTDLDTVHKNGKDVKYKGNSVVITDTDGSVLSQENVELKGRGNTTWQLSDKKGYQIKFDNKQEVLGMAAAKKWVLLANAFDDSLMRNSLGCKLADRLGMTFSADFEFVDLWVNGEYRGNYIIGEKNEIGGNRLDLSDSEGILCEYDSVFYAGEDIWFKTENSGEHFAVKETKSDNTEDINAGVNSFKKTYNDFVKYICNTDRTAVTIDELGKYVDVESVAQYYLVTEYMTNFESYCTSFFMYKDGENDVIHFGPVWDFDSSQGTFSMSYYADDILVYRSLLQTTAFTEYVKNYYSQNKGAFLEIQNNIASIKDHIASSANMNYTRWKWLGKTNPKDSSKTFASTYDAAVKNLASWHSERINSFNPGTTERKVYIENNRLVCNIADKGYTNISIAIWHNSDMSDLTWVNASKSGRSWIGSIALSDMTYNGIYNVHVYNFNPNGNASFVAGMIDYIDQTITADIYAEQTYDFQMTLRAEGASSCSSVRFAVWSDVNGQDDLIWYDGTKDQNMNWNVDVDLKNHFGTGSYNIHAYTGNKFIGAATCNVSCPQTTVSAVAEQESNFVTADIGNVNNYDAVKVAVWGDTKGQNDLVWYTANGYDGSYTADIDVANHNETGTYNMHVYGVRGSKWEFLTATKFNIDKIKKNDFKCSLTDSKRALNLYWSSTNKNYDSIKAAFWGSENGQNDLKWYDLSGGKAKIDVANHNETGSFVMHLYGMKNGKYSFIAAHSFNIDGFASSKLTLDKSGTYLTANCINAENYSDVRFAVWNSENGQDDLKWYNAKYYNGTWIYKADLSKHKGGGTVYVHAYGAKNGNLTFVAGADVAA